MSIFHLHQFISKIIPLTHTMIFDIFIFTYGAYSSAVERQIVDLVVVGSIPTRHPEKRCTKCTVFLFAIVAHLDRATDFESVGSTFESCQSHPYKKTTGK